MDNQRTPLLAQLRWMLVPGSTPSVRVTPAFNYTQYKLHTAYGKHKGNPIGRLGGGNINTKAHFCDACRGIYVEEDGIQTAIPGYLRPYSLRGEAPLTYIEQLYCLQKEHGALPWRRMRESDKHVTLYTNWASYCLPRGAYAYLHRLWHTGYIVWADVPQRQRSMIMECNSVLLTILGYTLWGITVACLTK
jgi:hypothetical protein